MTIGHVCGPGFHGKPLGRPVTVNRYPNLVVTLYLGGQQRRGYVTVSEKEGFYNSEFVVPAHLVNHSRRVDHSTSNLPVFQKKDIHTVLGDLLEVSLQIGVLYRLSNHTGVTCMIYFDGSTNCR